jgi:hypothetical protein
MTLLTLQVWLSIASLIAVKIMILSMFD